MPTPVTPGSQSITVGGITQHFHVAGHGPYCIVHSGGPGIDAGYLRLPLLEDRLTMIYLDPIGTGRSGVLPTHPTGYTVARFAEQMLGLVDALDLGRPFLLGHSHGAFVALEAALQRPEAFAGLVLYAGAAWTGGDFMAAAAAKVAAFLERHAGTPEADSVQKGWTALSSVASDAAYTTALRNLLPVYFADHRRSAPVVGRLAANLGATMLVSGAEPFDVRHRLAAMPLPTLVMVGAEDFILGPRYAATLLEGLPDAGLTLLKRSGHFAHLEEPDAFANAVIAFATPER
ncbi:alpha/beta fold hydrolase [Sphingomonas morindae]|uniref:Alpha/beta hydrolase n=1 Tax=Sphingomonas morindae TaxID=1541170 RepID=A0ABY4X9U4_9SPHN|nr:alpha/beta hydrolase [Sphingomonas morindae]USI73506.1 alpha/beta hydrolase [Sphingomonas morindae]